MSIILHHCGKIKSIVEEKRTKYGNFEKDVFSYNLSLSYIQLTLGLCELFLYSTFSILLKLILDFLKT